MRDNFYYSYAKYEAGIIDSKEIWENFVKDYEESNFLQSWSWGNFHERLGKKIHRIGFFHSKKLIGVMLVIVEEAKRAKYLTIGGGPLIDWQDLDLATLSVRTMKELAKMDNASFIRLRPQLHNSPENIMLISEFGFRPSPMHLNAEMTSQLDLTWNEQDLLAGMRKKTRYEIRQADKNDIKVLMTKDDSVLREFYDLQIETSKRQKFVPFSYKYLDEQFKAFAENNEVLLYRAEHDGQLLAEAFIIFYGNEADYHYGASTPEGREFPGAYAIQWAAIKEAKRRGMKRYNFWGITKPDETNHRFYGVSVFKRGFGGEDVEYLHAHDLVISHWRYWINWIIETIRKKRRKL